MPLESLNIFLEKKNKLENIKDEEVKRIESWCCVTQDKKRNTKN